MKTAKSVTNREVRKRTCVCVVCGLETKGTRGKVTCGDSCRKYLSYLKSKKIKPDFYDQAKELGQKVPVAYWSQLPPKVNLTAEKMSFQEERRRRLFGE